MANDIKFKVLGDVKDLENSLSKTKKSFDALGKASAVAFAGLTASAVGFISSARVQEQAIQALNQSLKNTGNFSEAASKDLIKYASALQSISLFGDETIIQAQSLIASFGFEGETLKKLTKATLDLAQAKGMDLTAAADLVAKSVGSSTNALSRYGVTVEGTVGSVDRASSAITNINKLFGGQAEAATAGLGSIKQMQNAISDLGEDIGTELAPTVIEITKNIKTFIEQMRENPEIAKTAAEVLKLSIVVTGSIAGIWAINAAWVATSGTFTKMLPTLMAIAANPVFLAGAAIALVGGVAKATWDWYQAESAVSRELEAQDAVIQASLAARGVTAGQVAADARMRIEIIKEVSATEIAAEQERLDTIKQVEDNIAAYKDGYREIANLKTQEDIENYIIGLEEKLEAELEYVTMLQEMYDEHDALTAAKKEELENLRLQANKRYIALELAAQQEKVNKMTAIEKKGYDLYKQINDDKIASLQSTLQMAAEMNSSFANAYKAVAIGQVVIYSAMGIMRAFAEQNFWVALGVSALIAAAGIMQIAKISSQSFAVGTPEVPGDMTAQVHAGEMIVPATFSEAIRSGELSLSGGGGATETGGGGGSIFMDFTGATFNGVTEGFVRDIFERASEAINNRTLAPLPA